VRVPAGPSGRKQWICFSACFSAYRCAFFCVSLCSSVAVPLCSSVAGLTLAQLRGVTVARATSCHYCPRWVSALWLALGFAALLLIGACRQSPPVLDAGSKPDAARGTITGTIRGPEGASPLSGRTVEIVNTATGERHSATTTTNGGFTSQLPKGRYRLELALRDGETLVAQPDEVNLDGGDVDSHVEFVLSAPRVVRPRGPAYHVDNGLGSPSA
jgi:hypothetical protein